MFKFWYKEFPQYPRDHKDFWRTRLISHSLFITTSFFLLLAVLNYFYFESETLALLDVVGFILSLIIYGIFRKTGNVNFGSWAVSLMATGLAMLFVIITGGKAHTLFWATLIPPFTFFLLGRNWGTIISAVAFSICAYLVYLQIEAQQSITLGLGSLLNVIEVSIAHILLFRFYEGTYVSAYRQLADKNSKIQTMAEHDKLTGLYNREKLDFKLNELLASGTTREPLTIMILDIDYFKKINDKHGHLVGDKVLTSISEHLRSQMRDKDLLARWGGEEFVVVLPDTSLQASIYLAERLRAYVEVQDFDGESLTISIGLAQYVNNESVDTLLDRADKALYQAKNQGRNRVVNA